jgi:Flp pilus assembly protein TadB
MNVTEKAVLLNYQANMESNKLSNEEVGRARDKKVEKQIQALEKQEDAAKGRADANDTQGGTSAIAGTLGAIAGVCACFPPIGTIVGAVLGVVAAGIALYGYLSSRGKEEQAADLDHDAGMDNVAAEKLDAEIESAQEERKERRAAVQQQLQMALQQEQESAKVRQMTYQ